jgi:hypothetical protein
MENQTLSIREQILQVCTGKFDIQVASIRSYDELIKDIMPASIPESMIIAEFKQNTRSLNKIREGYNSREFLNAWKYSNGILESIELKKEPEMSNSRREYYKETYARFAFSEEKKVLYLNIYYAPLYARGWMYPLIDTENGLILGEPDLEWLS